MDDPTLPLHLTFWDTERGQHSLDQAQYIECTSTNIGKEEHDSDAASKLWTQGSADHVCSWTLKEF